MRVLDKKLVRDLGRLRGQVVTIALVVACGIASYVAVVGTYRSLVRARDDYYERQHFAEVFADLTRGPRPLVSRIEELPGVALVDTRLQAPLRLPLPSPELSEPARGVVVSVEVHGVQALDRLHLVAGRLPSPGREDEVVLLEAFASAHGLGLGDELPLVLEGVHKQPRIVGIAMSPDFVFPVVPGELAFDPAGFGVVWMERSVLARALRMEGAFSRVSLRLQPSASRAAVLEELDRLLAPYGGRLAHGRDKHPSNALLDSELTQLESMATVIPLIFLGVAAFLVNVVLSRLVALERPEIAALKAMGYSDRALGLHYVKLVSLIVMLGALLGCAGGAIIGRLLTELYTQYFRIPDLRFRFDASLATQAVVVSLLSAFGGALASARSVMRLVPAEAMRPPEPPSYREGLLPRLGKTLGLGSSASMVLREISRNPLRTLLSALGIAMAIAILVVGRFSQDAVDYLMEVQFRLSQREDVTVTFADAMPLRAVRALGHLPGVSRAEGLRQLPVRIRSGHVSREAVLAAGFGEQTLRRIVDSEGKVHLPPPRGVMLTRKLAEVLRVQPGGVVTADVLVGEPRTRELVVSATVDDLFGLNAYMDEEALREWLGEPELAELALLTIDERRYDALARRLSDMPQVLGVARHAVSLARFEEQTAGQMTTMTAILTVFAAIIAIGVIYNNARIALSMRARDLSSLRVLGYRRGEISAVLLFELAIQTLLALGPGVSIGWLLALGIVSGTDPEVYRFPVVIGAQTYAFAISVTLAAASICALLVRRRLDRLDLIAVLKTRE